MRAVSISRRDPLLLSSPIELEASLLELFAPTVCPTPVHPLAAHNAYTRLWKADAVHRAKNMAQMTASLADVAEHPSRLWLPPEVTSQARRLSRAYDELGIENGAPARVPCAPLLIDIMTRLSEIFGRSRHIAMSISAEAVSLPSDIRRALILIGSELVINALKYGYPAQTGGTISVSLVARHGEVELIVEDDGVGLIDTYRAGQGGGLLERLRLVLGATVTRTTSEKGHGYRVSTLFPADQRHGDGA